MIYIQPNLYKEISNIIYKNTEDVNSFFENPPLHKFILVSSNGDGAITNTPNKDHFDADSKLIPDNLIHWFGQNVKVKHPKLTSIPIGLEDDKWFPNEKKKEKILQLATSPKKVHNLCYMNFNVRNNKEERFPCYRYFVDKPWVTTDMRMNSIDFNHYIDMVKNHIFCISPEGNGIDTHRTWESLYIGTIPIEKRNINNSFYEDLPICFVDKWEDVTQSFLISEYNRITKKLKNNEYNLQKLDFNYWKILIESYGKNI